MLCWFGAVFLHMIKCVLQCLVGAHCPAAWLKSGSVQQRLASVVSQANACLPSLFELGHCEDLLHVSPPVYAAKECLVCRHQDAMGRQEA